MFSPPWQRCRSCEWTRNMLGIQWCRRISWPAPPWSCCSQSRARCWWSQWRPSWSGNSSHNRAGSRMRWIPRWRKIATTSCSPLRTGGSNTEESMPVHMSSSGSSPQGTTGWNKTSVRKTCQRTNRLKNQWTLAQKLSSEKLMNADKKVANLISNYHEDC